MTRYSKEGEGAEILEFPQEPRDPTDSSETAVPRAGSMLAAMRAIAGDMGVKPHAPAWPTEVAVALRRRVTEAQRAERAHRQTMCELAAATRGMTAADLPGCVAPEPAKVLETVRQMHGDIKRKDELLETAAQTVRDQSAEIEALRRELARRGE